MASIKFNYPFLQLSWQRCYSDSRKVLMNQGLIPNKKIRIKQQFQGNKRLPVCRDVCIPGRFLKYGTRGHLCGCYFHSALTPTRVQCQQHPQSPLYIQPGFPPALLMPTGALSISKVVPNIPQEAPFNPAWPAHGALRCQHEGQD